MRRAAAAIVTAGLLLASCGVPVDRQPRALDETELPSGLSSTTTTTVDQPEPAGVEVDIFLVGEDDLLVPVKQEVPVPVDTKSVIETLIGSADADSFAELLADERLRTEIPADTVVIDAVADGGVLTVNLGPEGLATLEPEQQLLAIAQMVFTATGLESVDGVLLAIDGELRPLPTLGEPTEGQRPVTREDYANLG
ncbi:MAG: GerMN domain-containing protein [Acidimicrobiia bacterium]|nr:GerMN domain-containing protein [Acidimicrobiia bacterium]